MIISTSEQYESALRLLKLMESLELESSSEIRTEYVCNFSEEWASCELCEGLKADCNCWNESIHGRYQAEYDDEASFDS